MLQQRQNWEELPNLSQLSIPHCYMSSEMETLNFKREIHVFADTSGEGLLVSGLPDTEKTNTYVAVSFLAGLGLLQGNNSQCPDWNGVLH